MKRSSYYLILLMAFMCFSSNAQEKFEREYRISPDVVPNKAQEFVQMIKPEKRVKWYHEESQQGISIEAKTSSNGLKYSVEFDTNGVLLDVEILIKNLPKRLEVFLRSELNKQFDRSVIEKVQIQFAGSNEEVLKQIDDFHQNIISEAVHYEVIVRTKSNKKSQRYEYTINTEGKITEVLRLVQRETDNLEY